MNPSEPTDSKKETSPSEAPAAHITSRILARARNHLPHRPVLAPRLDRVAMNDRLAALLTVGRAELAGRRERAAGAVAMFVIFLALWASAVSRCATIQTAPLATRSQGSESQVRDLAARPQPPRLTRGQSRPYGRAGAAERRWRSCDLDARPPKPNRPPRHRVRAQNRSGIDRRVCGPRSRAGDRWPNSGSGLSSERKPRATQSPCRCGVGGRAEKFRRGARAGGDHRRKSNRWWRVSERWSTPRRQSRKESRAQL